jgi:hypothetical protein
MGPDPVEVNGHSGHFNILRVAVGVTGQVGLAGVELEGTEVGMSSNREEEKE